MNGPKPGGYFCHWIIGGLSSSRASDRWIGPLLAVVLAISGVKLLS